MLRYALIFFVCGAAGILSSCQKKANQEFSASCGSSLLASQVLATFNGRDLSFSDLDTNGSFRLARTQYELNLSQERAVRDLVLEKFVATEALANVAVTAEEVDAFIKKNSHSFPSNMPQEKLKAAIEAHLLASKRADKKSTLVQEFKDKLSIKTPLSTCPVPIQWPKEGSSLMLQKASAAKSINLTYYGSIDCSECRVLWPYVEKLVKSKAEAINFEHVYLLGDKEDPKHMGARAAYCVAQQGVARGWDYLSEGYKAPMQNLNNESGFQTYIEKEVVVKMQLAPGDFKTCLESKAADDHIAQLKTLHEQLAYPMRPMILVDRQLLLFGSDNYEEKIMLINDVVSRL